MIGTLIALAAILAAAAILFFRVRAFFLTKGQSACEHCPFSGCCHRCTKT